MTEYTSNLTVADIGERQLIGLIAALLPPAPVNQLIGIGDDCAVVASVVEDQILTTDMLVEGTHFDTHVDWYELGRKAVVANVSDVASMGGRPAHILVSVAFPSHMHVDNVLALYRGMNDEAQRWSAPIVGGDTVRSPLVVINVALTGYRLPSSALLTRSGCIPGQSVYVSGTLGDSMAGLKLLMDEGLAAQRETPYARALIARHRCPEPRVALGQALARFGSPTGLIDISDSLMNELSLLAQASSVGFKINADAVPVSPQLTEFCHVNNLNPASFALFSGEEYELLFTSSVGEHELREKLRIAGVSTPVHRIGEATSDRSIVVVDSRGNPIDLADQTFQHF